LNSTEEVYILVGNVSGDGDQFSSDHIVCNLFRLTRLCTFFCNLFRM